MCILRLMPLKALGGRCPYEVVTGLKPRMPAALDVGNAVELVNIDDYMARLFEYFRVTHKEVRAVQERAVEEREERVAGHLSHELEVGDVVLIRRDPMSRREGPVRFQPRTYPDMYRVTAKVGTNTVRVCPLVDPAGPVPVAQPVNGERLVRVELPELNLDPHAPRKLEIHDRETDSWVAWNVERFAVDGRVRLRRCDDERTCRWFDLSNVKYRWLC